MHTYRRTVGSFRFKFEPKPKTRRKMAKISAVITQQPLADLTAYAQNARTHNATHVEQIATSIRTFGFTNPILVDESRGIIAGHGRVLAAKALGMTEVPTIELANLSEDEKRAYILADNKLALNAGWDEELLSQELATLREHNFDTAALGFSVDELNSLVGMDHLGGLTDEDDTPELADDAVSERGDVWTLGAHRLMCGDATSADDVSLLLGNVEPHLLVTDPPYGVNFDPTWRKGSEKRSYDWGTPDDEGVWEGAWALFPGDVIYIWYGTQWTQMLYAALDRVGFDFRAQIIWNKMRFIIGRGHYCISHDTCFYGVRKNKTAHWQGSRNQSSVWDIKHTASDTNHGAQKPVECMRRPIDNSSSVGQVVYDPFVGSGTTIIAAETTGRACYAMEIEPRYVDLVVSRWEAFTGKEATRG